MTLQQLLGDDYLVQNFGNGGSTISRDTDHPYIGQPEFEEASIFEPHIVVIMLGTNDAKPYLWHNREYRHTELRWDFGHFLDHFMGLPSRPILLLLLPPPLLENPLISPEILDYEVIPVLKHVVAKHEVGGYARAIHGCTTLQVIDLRKASKSVFGHEHFRGTLLRDNIHLNAFGSTEIASQVGAHLKACLRQPK
jgi:hypothetical protein